MNTTRQRWLIVLVASSFLAGLGACSSDTVVSERGTEPARTNSEDAQPAQDETEVPVLDQSLRVSLEGEDTVLIGTVESATGEVLAVSTDEVLSAGLQAKQHPERCPTLEAGYRFQVTNTTAQFKNDLREGDQALFIGQMCDEYREGRMRLISNAPNGRRVDKDGTIDLGGGDIITLDEARAAAGRSFAPVPVAADQLTVRASLAGDLLRVDATGSSSVRLGVTLCDPGSVELTSPVQDYFGPCSLQTVDSGGNVAPDRLSDGKLGATFRVTSERKPPYDVIVFGEDTNGVFQIRGIARVE